MTPALSLSRWETRLRAAVAALFLAAPCLATSAVSNVEFLVDSSNSIGGDTRCLAHLYITDSQGRKSGYSAANITDSFDSTQDIVLGKIPHTNVGRESIDSDTSEERGIENESVDLFPASAGAYSMVVFSTVSYSVRFYWSIAAQDSNGLSEGLPSDGQSFLLPGTTATFTLNYDPTPGKIPTVAKTLSFPILRHELQAAFQLGDIGGKKFVDELDDVLAQGEKALARANRDHDKHDDSDGKREALAKLREFVKRVNGAARINHGDVGHDRDRDDNDRHFATATAAQSLTSDANTLIAQLGGKPRGDGDDHDRNRERH